MRCIARGCLAGSEQQAQKQEKPHKKNREGNEGRKRGEGAKGQQDAGQCTKDLTASAKNRLERLTETFAK